MPGVTEEQITAAKQMSAIEFLRRYRPGQLVKAESRGEFQLKEHDSFKINETTSLWHWKSRDVGGKSALDYLIKVEGLKFVEAVQTLCGENPSYVPPVSQPDSLFFVSFFCQVGIIAAFFFRKIPDHAVLALIGFLNMIGCPPSRKIVIGTDFDFFNLRVTGEKSVQRNGFFHIPACLCSFFRRINPAKGQPPFICCPFQR